MEITALCKVVDNFGDIGVVWRLCKNIKKIKSDVNLNLVVDDLISFNKICSDIDTEKEYQIVNDVNVYSWNANELCYKDFSENDGEKLGIILECFQCGRPDWMEKILFEEKLERITHIIMIDYLTAEKYAEDFHCLDSLTRSKKVRKVNFMPGFTEKTGGLIIDDEWKNFEECNVDGKILVFTYERDWRALSDALYEDDCEVLVAQGRGYKSFIDSCGQLQYQTLPFVNQEEWDKVLKKCSCLIIRGEESMSRACLSGIPFIWHAYPQSDEYQMVKVNALLDRMRKHFSPEDFKVVERVWIDFNMPENEVNYEKLKKSCKEFLEMRNRLIYGFKDFALDLRKNGDLCYNLMTFIGKICIMK